jgi:signal transduction histidine kinase
MNNQDDGAELKKENEQLRGDLLTVATRISHDLRTPLGGILSAAEALREIACEEPSATRTLVDSLVVSAEELSKMIKDTSFVLKATASPLPKEPLKMEGVFACALQRLENRIVRSGATITQPPSWPQVDGVAQWLETVWSIILGYSLQRDGNSPKSEVGWRDGAGEKIFWVRDNIGIPPEQRAGLFQPFDSLHQLNSVGGLNFAIARRLVELQGGRCGCDEDSSVFFTLPD